MKTNRNLSLMSPAWIAGLSLWVASAPALQSKAAPPLTNTTANRALALDGKTGFMQVPDSSSLHAISNSITLEAWCLANSFYPTRGSVNSILRKNVTAGAENFFLRIRNTEGPALIEVGLGSQPGVLRAEAKLKTNQWYHLAGTYDGRTVAVYVNGTRVNSQAAAGSLKIDSSDLVIGKGDPEFSDGEYFHGLLDEVRVWNVARSANEIQAALRKPLTGKEKGLMAYWTFDNGTAKDSSGKGLSGRLQGDARIVAAERPTVTPVTGQNGSLPQPNIEPSTGEQRLEVLEALWKNLSEIYPALEYKGIRGREWIEPAVRRIREAKSDAEFYNILLEQMASLQDTHTRILSYPGQPQLESPPVMLNRVEGRVAVIRAHPVTTLSPGDIITSVEKRPVEACLAEHMRRACNSTELGRFREACGQLLLGPRGTTVTVNVEGATGSSREVTLRRESQPDFWGESAISSRSTGESIGYIRISRWTDGAIPEQFDRALETFKSARGIVIDVRGNGGGNDQLADVVNGRLITEPVVSSIDFWRNAGTGQYNRTVGWVQPRGPWTYAGRVAVLIDEASTSACEHFVSGIEAMKRVLLVGLPTNGAGGGPTSVKLPDGTRVAISRALGIRANGVVFEGHGIPPHVYAGPTLSDLRTGRDAALEIAKEWIASEKALPPRTQSLSRSADTVPL